MISKEDIYESNSNAMYKDETDDKYLSLIRGREYAQIIQNSTK